ncbi:hypothetical protein I7Z51_002382 [Vibrio parahaemolyticus]|uniref:hypothetical protein n=1 Tax=Vibrio TaxID=662 RepID=UPI001A8E6A38|nr:MULTISPECIES: hypothetical protein [Vibrio]EGQ7973460.1 hypothetical protein [Vibrio parahaemolyticus]MBO0208638.1 hypothetical protein [Vibrio sp. Vb0877]MCR9810899.1 hypothetical protein [Vibrio parahaemolyticus]
MKSKLISLALLATSVLSGCSSYQDSATEIAQVEKTESVVSPKVEARLSELEVVSPIASRTIRMIGLKRDNECGVSFTETEIMNIGQTNPYFGFFVAVSHVVPTDDLETLYSTAESTFSCDNSEWIQSTKTSVLNLYPNLQETK